MNKIYVPRVGDHIIGTITNKNNDYYTVKINNLYNGFLPCIDGFRGATKKIRPQLSQGDVVFCEILSIHNYNLIELTCKNVDETKSFSTNETYFGHLENGFTISIPLESVDTLWINSADCEMMMKISRFIKLSSTLNKIQTNQLYHIIFS